MPELDPGWASSRKMRIMREEIGKETLCFHLTRVPKRKINFQKRMHMKIEGLEIESLKTIPIYFVECTCNSNPIWRY